MIEDLNVRPETIKLPEENGDSTIFYIDHSPIFGSISGKANKINGTASNAKALQRRKLSTK